MAASPIPLIPTLFNSGVNASNVPLTSPGTIDPHFTNGIVTSPEGAWMANRSDAVWISTASDPHRPAGTYIYEISFSLPPRTKIVSLHGQFAVDNILNYISRVGSTDTYTPPSSGFSGLIDFDLVFKTNYSTSTPTIRFVTTNQDEGSPTGLMVVWKSAVIIEEPLMKEKFSGFCAAAGR